MLKKALSGVLSLNTEPDFTIEIVVVDNDYERSAENIVKRFQNENTLNIRYTCEPEKNISLARNRAVEYSTGNLIAFMDDDEFPSDDWLKHLNETLKKYKAAGILGPVLPHLPPGAPGWLKKSNVFDRKRFKTGTPLSARNTRTGNVLLDRKSFPDVLPLFKPEFGLTGGEDVDFFKRQIDNNKIYVWCDEAIVYETIAKERWPMGFHFRKYYRIGTLNGEKIRKTGMQGVPSAMKNAGSACVWICVTTILLPFGKARWIKPALKLTYSLACLLAYCGFSFMRHR